MPAKPKQMTNGRKTRKEQIDAILADHLPDMCIEYSGYRMPSGYGQVRVGSAMVLVHRYALESKAKQPNDKPFVLHSCHNPPCFNPKHLRWGTHLENMADRTTHGTHASFPGESHPFAKLTKSSVAAIRDRYASGGITQQALADEFEVHSSTISQLCLRKTWAHA